MLGLELEAEAEVPGVERALCLRWPVSEPELDGACAPADIENDPMKADRVNEDGPTSGGVTPHTIVIGHATGDEGRAMGPVLRARTALRRWGYQVGAVGASVGKSRI